MAVTHYKIQTIYIAKHTAANKKDKKKKHTNIEPWDTPRCLKVQACRFCTSFGGLPAISTNRQHILNHIIRISLYMHSKLCTSVRHSKGHWEPVSKSSKAESTPTYRQERTAQRPAHSGGVSPAHLESPIAGGLARMHKQFQPTVARTGKGRGLPFLQPPGSKGSWPSSPLSPIPAFLFCKRCNRWLLASSCH